MKKTKKNKKMREGFSLMETLIVVAIVGVFSGLVAIGGVQFRSRANVNAAKSEMDTFKLMLLDYYDTESVFPDSDTGLKILIDQGYLVINPQKVKDGKILDPWKNPYEYSLSDDGNGFTITSYGSDKKADGSGHAADIVLSEGVTTGNDGTD